MSSSPSTDSPSPAQTLEEVLRREAWLRVKFAHDFMAFETQVKAYRAKVQELSDELGARNTYIHELHLDRETRTRSEQAAWADLAVYSEMLRDAEDERAALREEVRRLRERKSWGSKAGKPAAERMPAGPAATLPGYDFLYYLYTSPFRLHRGDRVAVRGWAMPRDGRELTAVRVRLGDTGGEVFARVGLEEPEVIRQHGTQPKNPRPGFEVEFPVTPGRHLLRLEAQLERREWFSILVTPIWVLPNGARA